MSTAIDTRKYNAAVSRVRELLTNWIESGIELFLELREIERTGVWKLPGHAQFSDWLSSEFPHALGIERYNNVMRAIDVHGVDTVRKVGVHACHALAIEAVTQDPKRVKLVRASIDKFVEANRMPPTVKDVREIVHGIAGTPARQHASTRALERDDTLQAELEKARERIRVLERELKIRDKQVAALKKQLAEVSRKNKASKNK